MEAAFDDSLTANRLVLDGLRGVFTFLVLYEHFHDFHRDKISSNFVVNTYLFVLISGFTTSLQLRDAPRFETKRNQHDALPTPSGGQDTAAAATTLQKRQPFGLAMFMQTRIVGLFPALWIALLLNIPMWNAVHTKSQHVQVTCSALYVIGMQSWYRPECAHYGPNNVLYASIIFNDFIIYAVVRYLFSAAQNYLMTWASPRLCPPVAFYPLGGTKNRTWRQFIGEFILWASFRLCCILWP
jgi:hypothetical protein